VHLQLSFRSEEQSGLVQVYFLDIMLTCFETSSAIPQAALELVLVHVLGQNESGSCSKPAHALAKRLLQQGVRVLEPAIAPLLCDILLGNVNETVTNLRERIHDTIYKLQQVAPDLLITVLPHLERELSFEDLEVRKRVVELLAKLFAEYPHLHSNQFTLYNRFIGRFKDVDASIRCILGSCAVPPHVLRIDTNPCFDTVEFAKFMILRSSDAKVAEDLSKHLLDRLRDHDEAVRSMAVDTVIEVASESNLEKLPQIDLLNEIVLRMRDRRPSIREKAVNGIASLWSMAHEKWDARKSKKQVQDGSGWNKERRKFFDSVPMKVFFCYAVPDAEDKMRVEELVSKEFCPSSLDPEVRAQRLLTLYNSICAESGGREVFRRFLHDKKVFRQGLLGALDSGSDKSKAQRCREVVGSFVSGVEQLTKINNDEGVVRSLRLIAGGGAATSQDVSTSDKKVRSAVESVLRQFNSKGAKVKNFISNVIVKASVGFVDRLATMELVGLLKHAVDDEDDREVNQTLSLIEDLSAFCPQLFSGSAAHSIMDIVKAKSLKAAFADRALKALSNVSAVMGSDAADGVDGDSAGQSKKTLMSFVVKGTPSQAKWAIRSLMSSGTSPLAVASSVTKDIVEKHLKTNSTHLEASFASLRQIAKSSLGRCSQKDSLVKELKAAAEFAITSCLKADDEAEDIASAKAQAAAFLGQFCVLVNSFRDKNQQSPNPKASKKRETNTDDELVSRVVETLQDLLNIDVRSTDEDIITLCVSSAGTLLKMASCKPIDSHLIPIEVPQQLCALASGKSAKLRRSIAAKIAKRISDPHSSLKYLAIASFFGMDSDKETAVSTKKAIHAAIDMRRRFKQDSEDHLLEQVDRLPEEEGQALLARTYASLLPEYALPWLVYFIAHQDWFSKMENGDDDEDQAKSVMDKAAHVLHVLIDNLCAGIDNYGLLQQMLFDIKLAKDVRHPESHAIQMVSEIANLVVDRRLHQATKSGFAPKPAEIPAQILLPAQLYGNPDSDSQTDGTSKKLTERAFIPKSYNLPPLSSEVAKSAQTHIGRKVASKRKRTVRKAEPKSDEEDAETSDSESESHSASRSRSTKSKPAPKRRKTKESEEEEDMSSSDSDQMDVAEPLVSPSKARVVPRRAAVGKAEEVRKNQKQMVAQAKHREKLAEEEANAESEDDESVDEDAMEAEPTPPPKSKAAAVKPKAAPSSRKRANVASSDEEEGSDAEAKPSTPTPAASKVQTKQVSSTGPASKRNQAKRTTGKR
jgi:hypothetical protein